MPPRWKSYTQQSLGRVTITSWLTTLSSYLQVPADIWFEWTPKMRETYVLGVQKLSLQDVYKQKDVPWSVLEPTDNDSAEFRPLEDDIVTELVDSHGYSNESAKALKEEVLYLLNHLTAIQRKASLQTEGVVQFEVASTGAKNGTGIMQLVFVDGISMIKSVSTP